MKIAIVGHGFVGGAVEYGFSNVEKYIVDPKYGTEICDLEEPTPDFQERGVPDFTFICVPTPMGEDGSIDEKHIRSSLEKIAYYWHKTVVVIKSTVTPQVLTQLQKDFNQLDIVYNPEFLTERAAKDDFVNPPFHILGGRNAPVYAVEDLYENYSMCTPCPVYKMTMEEASYVKYAINTFLATKVIFLNQLKDAMDAEGLNFQRVVNAVCADPRIGYSHSRVPGFDGKPGYGGACFPKDVSALIHSGHFPLLNEVHRLNVEYRKDLELDEREKEQNVHFA